MLIGLRGLKGSGKGTVAETLQANCEKRVVLLAFADFGKELGRDLLGFTHTAMWGPSQAREEPSKEAFSNLSMWLEAKNLDRLRVKLSKMGAQVLGSSLDTDLVKFVDESVIAMDHLLKRGPYIYPTYSLSARRWLTCYCESLRIAIPGVWTRALMKRLREVRSAGDVFIVTDVRRLDEVQALHDIGAEIWHVEHHEKYEADLDAVRFIHPSEREYVEAADDLGRYDTVVLSNDGTAQELAQAALSEYRKAVARHEGEARRLRLEGARKGLRG